MFEIIYRYDPARPRDRRPPRTPREARRRLEEGNQSFTSLAAGAADRPRVVHLNPADIGLAEPGGVPVQQPFAVVLGCSDARVPTEMIFDRACNELFVVRAAGNVIGPELLGSIDYAVGHFGRDLKLIVVLGHSQCGAVTDAVAAFLDPAEYLSISTSHLRSIINILFPAARGAARALSAVRGDGVSKLPGYRAALIETAVVINAALTASILRNTFGDPSEELGTVFGVYDLASRRVQVPLPPAEGSAPAVRLLDAPRGREEFRQLASQVARSPLVTRLLEREAAGEETEEQG